MFLTRMLPSFPYEIPNRATTKCCCITVQVVKLGVRLVGMVVFAHNSLGNSYSTSVPSSVSRSLLIISFHVVQVLKFGPTLTVSSVRMLRVSDRMKSGGVVVIPSFAITQTSRGRPLPIRSTDGAGRVAVKLTDLESTTRGLLGDDTPGEPGSSNLNIRVLLVRVGSIMGGGNAGSRGMKLMYSLTARLDLKRPGLMTLTRR